MWRECVDSDDERSELVPLAMLERILVSHGARSLVGEDELRTLLLKMRLPSEGGGKSEFHPPSPLSLSTRHSIACVDRLPCPQLFPRAGAHMHKIANIRHGTKTLV